MGVHSGPVSGVVDVNERANIAGAGINLAQRVMDCGDAGHILLSKRVAEDLDHYGHWQPHLHDLGECEVKHGVRLHVVNLFTEDLGNPQFPKKFQSLKKHSARVRWAGMTVALFALAAIIAGIAIFSRYRVRSTPVASEKSIAVLPFDNLSRDPENAYSSGRYSGRRSAPGWPRSGAEGNLTHLDASVSKVHPVIAPDRPQIGVANILEGSVQKPSDQVRVNVQLIHAATDTHLWADTYDHKLTDVFAVESEIAKTVAERLQAKLTGTAEHVLASRPTENPEAHQLYLKGRYFWNKRTTENLKKAIDYFEQAIGKDSSLRARVFWTRGRSCGFALLCRDCTKG